MRGVSVYCLGVCLRLVSIITTYFSNPKRKKKKKEKKKKARLHEQWDEEKKKRRERAIENPIKNHVMYSKFFCFHFFFFCFHLFSFFFLSVLQTFHSSVVGINKKENRKVIIKT